MGGLMPPGDDEFDRGPSESALSAPGLGMPTSSGDFSRVEIERGWGGAPAAGIVTLATLVAGGVRGLFRLARRNR
jgi:hypothetical protein